MSTLAYQWINFIILAVGLIFLLKRALDKHFKKEREDLEKRMGSAEAQFENIQSEFRKTEKLLKDLPMQMDQMKQESLRQIEVETQKIEKDTARSAEKIIHDAELRALNEVNKARRELEAEVLDKALAAAKESLQKDLKKNNARMIGQIIQDDDIAEGKQNYAS